MNKTVGIIDEPVPPGSQDNLGIDVHTKSLIDFITDTSTPITVGIQGEWAVVLMTLLSTMATFVGLSRYIKGQEQQHYQPILLGVLLASPSSSILASQA